MNSGTAIAALVFVLIALAQVVGIASGVPVTLGTTEVPTWASAVGIVVAFGLAFVLLREARAVCKREGLAGMDGKHAP